MAAHQSQQVDQAYEYCQQVVRSHYENFPVASFILPKRLRRPISVIYTFARNADDFADEGNLDEHTRLAKLKDYDTRLDEIAAGRITDDPVFVALADVVKLHELPLQLFHDLITAFRLDVTKKRYQDINEVWDYCRFSANPVGRLLLHLTGNDNAKNLELSDAICSGLQLINFLQDIEQDLTENDRIYLPQDDMLQFQITEDQLRKKVNNEALRELIDKQIQYARKKMLYGKSLGDSIRGRFGFQLRIMINGGIRVLELLEQQEDMFSRPRLKKSDWLRMVLRSL